MLAAAVLRSPLEAAAAGAITVRSPQASSEAIAIEMAQVRSDWSITPEIDGESDDSASQDVNPQSPICTAQRTRNASGRPVSGNEDQKPPLTEVTVV